MVDAVGVLLGEGVVDDLVEVLGRREVSSEGFLDDSAAPAVLRMVEARLAEVEEDVVEELGRRGKVIKPVRAGSLGLHLVEPRFQGEVTFMIAEFARVVADVLRKTRPEIVVVALARDFLVQFLESLAEFLVRFLAAGDADDAESRRQIAVGGEVVKRGDELAVGEVTGCSKDHENA